MNNVLPPIKSVRIPSKSLIVYKYNKHKYNLSTEINDVFDNPDTFLKMPCELNTKIIVGKNIRAPNFDKDEVIHPYYYVGNIDKFIKKSIHTPRLSGNLSEFLLKSPSKNAANQHKIKAEKLTDKNIRKIFDSFKESINDNKDNENDYLKSIPIYLRNELKKQERKLRLNNYYSNSNKSIKEKIKKVIKKNQLKNNIKINEYPRKRSLIETSDSYFIRTKAFSNILREEDKNKLFDANNKWLISLRKPANFVGRRKAYVTYGKAANTKWAIIEEKIPKIKEKVANPEWKEDAYFFKQDFFLTKTIDNKKHVLTEDNIIRKTIDVTNKLIKFQKDTKKLINLEVKGINLFQFELDLYKQLKGCDIILLESNMTEDMTADIIIVQNYKNSENDINSTIKKINNLNE